MGCQSATQAAGFYAAGMPGEATFLNAIEVIGLEKGCLRMSQV